MSDAKKKCFVISPIGDPAGAIRAEADWLLKGVIKPALEPDFEVKRADEFSKTDVITNQVILAIKNADLIVADLSGHNPNVFYELALAHAYERPVVPMIRSDQTIPFDNHAMATIFYSRDRIENWEQAKADLKSAAKDAVLPDHKVTNPVTIALGFGQVRAGPEDRDSLLTRLMETVEEHSFEISHLRHRTGPLLSFRGGTPSSWMTKNQRRGRTIQALTEILQSMYGTSFSALTSSDQMQCIDMLAKQVSESETQIERDLATEEVMELAGSLLGTKGILLSKKSE